LSFVAIEYQLKGANMNRYTLAAALTFVFAMPPAGLAADEGQGHHDAHEQLAQADAAHKLHGVVNSVNADAGRVNITHDPVESLKWPKMKMNFKAHDPALLTDIKPGMRVDFEIQKMGNEYHLTQITPVK
jgi:Cu/Ag efflux protein CusF